MRGFFLCIIFHFVALFVVSNNKLLTYHHSQTEKSKQPFTKASFFSFIVVHCWSYKIQYFSIRYCFQRNTNSNFKNKFQTKSFLFNWINMFLSFNVIRFDLGVLYFPIFWVDHFNCSNCHIQYNHKLTTTFCVVPRSTLLRKHKNGIKFSAFVRDVC